MKKILTFLLLICFVFPVAQADEKIYLALGDSITTGYGLAASEKGFAKLIAEKNGYKLVNRAVNGATTADVLALLEQQSVLNTVAKADLITLTCGGNDLMGLLFMQSAAVYNTLFPEQISTGDAYAILTNPSRMYLHLKFFPETEYLLNLCLLKIYLFFFSIKCC